MTRTGMLITNVGTPDSPRTADVRRYLREFLWDRRVVDLPRPLWWIVLNAFVLPFRPARSAHAYRQIWTANGSPLLLVTQRQAQLLDEAVRARTGLAVAVSVGMGYGKPSIRSGLEKLRAQGCERILVLPMFPQYSSPTVGSAFDAVSRVLQSSRRVPELRFVAGYHDHPSYIGALVGSIREHWQQHGEPETLLLSFHGLPQRYVANGDPYQTQCETTARLVIAALGLDADRVRVAYQSRFGRDAWLQPYADVTLSDLGRERTGRVDVVCPGFAADCLETLEEIDVRYRGVYLAAGGRDFHYVPALNDRTDHIAALCDIVTPHLLGW